MVEEFNKCAITKHNCVAARVDVNKYPEPPPEALVNSFDINQFTVSSCWGLASVSQTVPTHNAKQQGTAQVGWNRPSVAEKDACRWLLADAWPVQMLR